MRPFDPTFASFRRLDLTDGVDGDEFLLLLATFMLIVVLLVLFARWRAARRLRFPGLADVLAWERVSKAQAVGDGAAPTTFVATTSAPLAAAPDGIQQTIEALRAEIYAHIERVQWRLMVGVAVTILLGIALGAAVGLGL